MSSYYIFTDEAGQYMKSPSDKFRRAHPFYIRANVRLSTEDYSQFQRQMRNLNSNYEIPLGEEIKWSDLHSRQTTPRTDFIGRLSPEQRKAYCESVLILASQKKSIQYFFTITPIVENLCRINPINLCKFHMQEVFQRVQMDLEPENGFATFIMDEFGAESDKQTKHTCFELTESSDFIKRYNNIYHGILTEYSNQSYGIQLADYAAGIMNGYLKRLFYQPNNYEFANQVLHNYILPNLRHKENGEIMGYGLREVPTNEQFRNQLRPFFKLIA